MTAADRLAEALLRLAARRWPASVREEQAREWSAELHALRSEPGTSAAARALGQLRFAFSLAAASPVDDESGVPRGWREGLPEAGRALQPLAVLVLFGVLATGPGAGIFRAVGEWLLGLAGVPVGSPAGGPVVIASSLPPLLVFTAVAWWLGRRMPPRWAGPGPTGSAARTGAAAVALAVAFAVLVVGTQSGNGLDDSALLAVSLSIAAVVWVLLTTALVMTVVRLSVRRRWWLPAALVALAGTPLVVELAVAAAALPGAVAAGAGLPEALRWPATLLSGEAFAGDAGSWTQTPQGIALFNTTNAFPLHLLTLTGLAVGHGLGAARPRPRVPAPLPAPAQASLRLPTAAAVTGVTAMLAGLLSWAYSLAILTPAMPLVGQTAPMPGGDGELYMWVAELRWGAITLAALGLLLAAADRRATPLAAAAQTVVLLIADGFLARAEAAGPSGLRTALAVAAVTAALSWRVAGAGGRGADALVARRRLGWTAVAAACCGPILLAQGTPEVNHPFLPAGLAITTAALAAMLTATAGHAAAAARPAPLRPATLAAIGIGPALLLGAFGASTGAGVPNAVTMAGMLLAVPMTVLAVAVMRAPRPRSRAGAAVWIILVLTSPLLSILVIVGSLMLSTFVSNVLFAVAGSSWAADGLSLLPGAVVLGVAMGVVVSRSLIHPAEPPPGRSPGPVPTGPEPWPGAGRPAPIGGRAAELSPPRTADL